MEVLLSAEGLIALLTLTFLEIVLGVDNIIFISIVTNRLPAEKQGRTRTLGLVLALLMRIGLLLGISVVIKLDRPLFEVLEHGFSGKDLLLFIGGLFLIAKSTSEIHHKMEGKKQSQEKNKGKSAVSAIILQIILLDVIFSIDSILTAVGLTEHVNIMIIAVIISMIVMMLFAGKISDFINKHPSLQMLALAFLILIGFTLALEGLHREVEKQFIYFAVFFSLAVEVLNMRMRRKNGDPVKLRKRVEE